MNQSTPKVWLVEAPIFALFSKSIFTRKDFLTSPKLNLLISHQQWWGQWPSLDLHTCANITFSEWFTLRKHFQWRNRCWSLRAHSKSFLNTVRSQQTFSRFSMQLKVSRRPGTCHCWTGRPRSVSKRFPRVWRWSLHPIDSCYSCNTDRAEVLPGREETATSKRPPSTVWRAVWWEIRKRREVQLLWWSPRRPFSAWEGSNLFLEDFVGVNRSGLHSLQYKSWSHLYTRNIRYLIRWPWFDLNFTF